MIWLCSYSARGATHRSGTRETVRHYSNRKGDNRKGDWQFHRGEELQRHRPEINGFCCQADARNQMLTAPINPTPRKKLFRTKPLPCFNISPRTACAARYKNPPPTCAMNKASQNEDVFAKKKKPIIPPSSVVASTAATQPSARALGHPAPIKRLPNARPSGILWMQRAEKSDH